MDVSVVMINYNTYDFTCAALDCIFEQTHGLSYEVILIDNKSPDGSGEMLAEKYKDKIIYVQAGDNLGTSKAFNLGVAKSVGKYILWLNTDILIKENFIFKLYEFMQNTPDCGICGGNILDFNGKPTHSYKAKIITPQSVRRDWSLTVKIFRKLFKRALSEQYNFTGKVKKVGYITGADMMIRRELIEQIGPFDEDIFMYAEEVEFTYRAHTLTDYTVCSVPDAHIYHLEGASFNGGKKQFNPSRFKTLMRGNSVYIKKHFGTDGLLKYFKNHKRGYAKFAFLYACLFKKEKAMEYRQSSAILKEFICKVKNGENL